MLGKRRSSYKRSPRLHMPPLHRFPFSQSRHMLLDKPLSHEFCIIEHNKRSKNCPVKKASLLFLQSLILREVQFIFAWLHGLRARELEKNLNVFLTWSINNGINSHFRRCNLFSSKQAWKETHLKKKKWEERNFGHNVRKGKMTMRNVVLALYRAKNSTHAY